jgi:hypothetical protein
VEPVLTAAKMLDPLYVSFFPAPTYTGANKNLLFF